MIDTLLTTCAQEGVLKRWCSLGNAQEGVLSSKQAGRQASKQASKQAGKQARRQAIIRKAFSRSHAREGLVMFCVL